MQVIKGSGVYAITNTVNGNTYIGSTIRGFSYRWSLHIWELRHNTLKNRHLQAAWNKYGEDAFTFTVVEVVDDPALILAREQYWIDIWRARKQCYNIANATGPIGEDGERQAHHLTDEHKERISRALRGRKISEETKKKVGDGNRGKKRSPEDLRKMSERMKAKGVSLDFLRAGELAKAKSYHVPLLSPDGTRYEEITNLRAFCKEHNLNVAAMRRIIIERSMHNHRGWRRADEDPITREAAIARSMKARLEDPELRAKVARVARAAMDDPEYKARCLKGLRDPDVKERARIANIHTTYRFFSPDGTLYTFTDLRSFCEEHNLPTRAMMQVHKGNTRSQSCKGWRSASGEPRIPTEPIRGENHFAAKLREADIPQVFAMRLAGETKAAIARYFGVTRKTIFDLLRGKTWKHIPRPEGI